MQDGEIELKRHDIFYTLSHHGFLAYKNVLSLEEKKTKFNLTHFSSYKSTIGDSIKYVMSLS